MLRIMLVCSVIVLVCFILMHWLNRYAIWALTTKHWNGGGVMIDISLKFFPTIKLTVLTIISSFLWNLRFCRCSFVGVRDNDDRKSETKIQFNFCSVFWAHKISKCVAYKMIHIKHFTRFDIPIDNSRHFWIHFCFSVFWFFDLPEKFLKLRACSRIWVKIKFKNMHAVYLIYFQKMRILQ